MRTAPTRAPERALPGMAWIPGGESILGSGAFYPAERAVHQGAVDSFWTDTRPVTVAELIRFVAGTGYQTVSERPLVAVAADCQDADPDVPAPGSLVTEPGRDLVVAIRHKILMGGSQLCVASYRLGGRPAARQGKASGVSTAHLGFCCVIRSGPLLGRPGGGPAIQRRRRAGEAGRAA